MFSAGVFLNPWIGQCASLIVVTGGYLAGIQWVEAEDPAKHPIMHRTASPHSCLVQW